MATNRIWVSFSGVCGAFFDGRIAGVEDVEVVVCGFARNGHTIQQKLDAYASYDWGRDPRTLAFARELFEQGKLEFAEAREGRVPQIGMMPQTRIGTYPVASRDEIVWSWARAT